MGRKLAAIAIGVMFTLGVIGCGGSTTTTAKPKDALQKMQDQADKQAQNATKGITGTPVK